MADVFISYSRTDSVFVHALDDHLKSEGRDVWVDWEDIPPASDWQSDIYEAIDASESFVFVVSPRSLASEYCGRELAHAQQGGKRIVPIALDDADPGAASPALAQLNWIWCRSDADTESAFAKLTNALETDLAWAKAHTRLLGRAVEWESRSRDPSYLLRGRDLTTAEQALATNAAKQPSPTEIQQRFVHASRRGSARRQRVLLGGVSVALAVSVALGVLALLQRNSANARAQVARSQGLAAQATEALSAAPGTALRDAVRAAEIHATPEAEAALRNAIVANPIAFVIHGRRAGTGTNGRLFFAGAGRLLAGVTPNDTLHVWNASTGATVAAPIPHAALAVLAAGRLFTSDRRTVRAAVLGARHATARQFAPGTRVIALGSTGGQALALVTGHGTAAVVPVAGGAAVPLREARSLGQDVGFSANGRRVFAGSTDGGHVGVWETRTGRRLAEFPGSGADAAISPDGREIATTCCPAALWSVRPRRRLGALGDASRVAFDPSGRLVVELDEDGTARLYRAHTGTPIGLLPGFGTLSAYGRSSGITVFSTVFHPGLAFDGQGHIAIANVDGKVRVWQLSSTKVVATVSAGYVNSLAFGPGGRLAAMTWDGAVVVARLPSSASTAGGLARGQQQFTPQLDQDGTQLVLPAGTGARVAGLDGSRAEVFPMPDNGASGGILDAWAISGDGSTVAASAGSNPNGIVPSFRSWTAVWHLGDRSPIRRFPQTRGPIILGRNGSLIAFDGKAWRTASGQRVRTLDGIRLLSADGTFALVRRRGTAAIVHSGSSPTALAGFGRLAADDDLTGAFSLVNARLVTTSSNGTRLWNVATGEQIAKLGGADEVASAGFGDHGRLVLVVFGNRAAVFDAADGRPLRSLPGTFDAIAPDGDLAAKGTDDGVVEIAAFANGVQTALPTDTTLPLSNLSFVSDSSTLLATDANGAVHLIHCPVCAGNDVLLARARALLAALPAVRQPPLEAVG